MSIWDEFGDKPNKWISMKEFDVQGGKNLTLKSIKKVVPDDEDYIITGTMNEVVKDKKGNLVLNKKGEEIPNSYYDDQFPEGYSLVMEFDEGTMNVSSFPFLKEFNTLRPELGQTVNVQRLVPDGDKTKTNFVMKVVDMDFSE